MFETTIYHNNNLIPGMSGTELRKREDRVVVDILSRADVVVGTLLGFSFFPSLSSLPSLPSLLSLGLYFFC